MNRYLRMLAVLAVLSLAAAACGTGEDTGGPEAESTGAEGELQSGGTLKLGISADVDQAFDPAEEYSAISWEIFRCCLLRTMLSFSGQEAEDGGNEPRPDLATDMPEVSEDGLTYTFTLKEGINYAPPYQDTPVVAGDFVRAIERLACDKCSDEGYPFYYDVIEGFEDSNGEAGSVTGATAPDDQTLVITLTQPTGDFPYRMTMPATAPIPEGAATGHDDDYGRYLIATGPYMFEGSESITAEAPVPGYDPDRSWSLVRNPSWDPETDEMRPAYVDAIQVTINESTDVNFQQWEAGDLDLIFDGVPPKNILQKYTTDPALKEQLHVNPSDGLRYLAMNLAQPPFDDVHVRRALNLVMDKEALRLTRGGELFGNLASHIIPDTLLDFQLQDFVPSWGTDSPTGDVEAAKAEMAQSKYDKDGDGVCDDPACQNVLLIADEESPYPDQNAVIQQSSEQIGITYDIRSGDRYKFMYDTCDDPASQFGLCPSVGWFKDYSDAFTFGFPLLHSGAIESSNYSLVGASAEVLNKAGYQTTEVPGLDADIDACALEPVGDSRIACWAGVDQKAMEEIVPMVPWLFDNDVDISGPRIVNYTNDAMSGLMALEQVALAGGGAEA